MPGLEDITDAADILSNANFDTFMNYVKGIGIALFAIGATVKITWDRYKEVKKERIGYARHNHPVHS
jgi:hypothetical protein